MFLSDTEIIFLQNEYSILSPWEKSNLTPNGYDLRIGDIEGHNGPEAFQFHPGTSARIFLLETFKIPRNIVGTLYLRSTFLRQGVIANFGVVDAGFHGRISIMIHNLGNKVIDLVLNSRITQLALHRLSSEAELDYASRSGNYQNLVNFEDEDKRIENSLRKSRSL